MPSTRTAILSSTDYYPFGMAISSRSSAKTSEKYAFGFGGQQKSTEINAQGNSYTAQFWQYDARIGRRLNLDPIDQFSISNYAAFRNNPIAFVDPLGNAASKQTNQKLGNGDSQIMTDILEDGNSGLDVHASDEVTGLSKDYHVDDAVCVYKPKEKAPAGSTYTESYARKASRLFKPLDYDKYGGEGEGSADGANTGYETKQGKAIGWAVVGVLSGGTGLALSSGLAGWEIALASTSLLMNANSLTTDKSGNSTFITRTVNNETFTKAYGAAEFAVNAATFGTAGYEIAKYPSKFLNSGNFTKVPTYFGLFPDGFGVSNYVISNNLKK